MADSRPWGTGPDFGKWFHVREYKPLNYVSRIDENFHHDVAYIASYINDACFHPFSLRLHRKKLTIDLDRDCWEVLRATNDLPVVKCQLTVATISSVRWEMTHDCLLGFTKYASSSFLSVTDLQVIPVSGSPEPQFNVVLSNPFYRLILVAEDGLPIIRLQDRSS